MSDLLDKNIHPAPCPFCQSKRIGLNQKMANSLESSDFPEKRISIYWLYCHDCHSTGPLALTQKEAAQKWGVKIDDL